MDDACRACGREIDVPGHLVACPQCSSCVACGAVATLVLQATDDTGEVTRCSVCGRDSRGFPGATGPVLRCIEPPQHRHLVLPLPISADHGRTATVGRSDLMHWPERSSATNSISRSHIRIRRDGSRYLVEDLSTNGTSLRGEELVRGRPQEVHDGDLIALVTTSAKPVLVLEFCLPRERAGVGDAPAAGPRCPHCGAPSDNAWTACPECGKGLGGEPATDFSEVAAAPAQRGVEAIELPEGSAPSFAPVRAPPPPPAPKAPRTAPSKQRESELEAEQSEGPAESTFEEGLAALLSKTKPAEGEAEPRRKPKAK